MKLVDEGTFAGMISCQIAGRSCDRCQRNYAAMGSPVVSDLPRKVEMRTEVRLGVGGILGEFPHFAQARRVAANDIVTRCARGRACALIGSRCPLPFFGLGLMRTAEHWVQARRRLFDCLSPMGEVSRRFACSSKSRE